jgi:hypothetical protein
MKRTFIIAAFSVVLAFAFSACTDPNQTDYDIKKEALTLKDGWVLTTATCAEGYELEDGGKINNLFDGYIRDYEVDDIWYFDATGAQMYDYNKILDEGQTAGKFSLGNWTLSEDAATLSLHLPWYEGYPIVEAKLQNVDSKELKVMAVIHEDDGVNTKTVREYTFVLTFKKN